MKPQAATLRRLDIIRAATARGESDTQIARRLGVTRWAIEKLRSRYRIPSGWKPPPLTHGIYATYTGGCRCQPCRAAHTDWMRDKRRARYQAVRNGTAPPFKHGVSGYTNWGCRCDVCSAAHRGQMLEYSGLA